MFWIRRQVYSLRQVCKMAVNMNCSQDENKLEDENKLAKISCCSHSNTNRTSETFKSHIRDLVSKNITWDSKEKSCVKQRIQSVSTNSSSLWNSNMNELDT